MTNLKPVDVAIVGGGWTGLAMAKELVTRTGSTVVALERGAPRDLASYAMDMDELDYNIRLRMMQNIAEETVTHRHTSRDPAVPVRQYGSFHPGTGVGGAGEHWTGMCFRFLPSVFNLRTHLTEKHGASHLPADLAVRDWGVTYEQLEPHYWYAEQMMGVSGKAGNLRGKLVEGGNIFEAPRMHEYPTPPLKNTYASHLFEEATKKLGYHPYPTPAANLSQNYTNPDGISRAACAYCSYCSRFGCMIGAKAQPTNTLLPVLRKHKAFELRTGSWVHRIVHENGRATGVQYTDANGQEFFQPAGNVLLCSFTLNNIRLLYLSKIGTPYDPETGKGSLGRNLTHQVEGGIRIFFDKPLNAFMGAGSLGRRISDFDGDNNIKGDDGLLRYGMLSLNGNGDLPIGTFGGIPPGTTKSNWGAEWKAAALKWRDRVTQFNMYGEHMSYRHNFVDLDPTYTDKFGDPLLRFTLDWTEHEHKQRDFAYNLAAKIAPEMGAKIDPTRPSRAKYNVINYQSTHIQGGATMGASPEVSVVNPYLQHWDVPNLWVIGASSFPQTASGNPTLTVMAVTYWAADAMINRYLRNPGKLA
ncbi:MAG TPA: GMC family oxidoreductase [Bryobacteraceae bacterium]|nr:GMC family oxidoreductase [Bryobacteraceae bacterium]